MQRNKALSIKSNQSSRFARKAHLTLDPKIKKEKLRRLSKLAREKLTGSISVDSSRPSRKRKLSFDQKENNNVKKLKQDVDVWFNKVKDDIHEKIWAAADIEAISDVLKWRKVFWKDETGLSKDQFRVLWSRVRDNVKIEPNKTTKSSADTELTKVVNNNGSNLSLSNESCRWESLWLPNYDRDKFPDFLTFK